MTAATAGPSGTNGFSLFSEQGYGLYRTRREVFLASMVGQALVIAVVIYLLGYLATGNPPLIHGIPPVDQLPLVFSGHNGGGGGNRDVTPATHGALPRASLDTQIVPPTIQVAKEMPKLAVEPTINVAPQIPLPHDGQLGNPLSSITGSLSGGRGGPGGSGDGCCGGVGDQIGPHFGTGSPGPLPAGTNGVTVPRILYAPEPSFSDEARKSKTQGDVTLLLVVGIDGRPYDIRVERSLGMGLDEKAMEAVQRWRFAPATFHDKPVPTRIEIQVNFRLY